MAVPRRLHCGLAQPAVHCGSFEHVQSVRCVNVKDRGFDSYCGPCHGGHGGAAAVMAVPRRLHCGLAQPAVHCGSFEHVQSVRCVNVKDRGFDSLSRCYGDQ